MGARPQFIKHAIVQKQLKAFNITEVLLHTGQHSDLLMSEIFFQELGMQSPTIVLQIAGSDSLSQLGSMLEQMHRVLLNERFDCVLVYGDTTSTLAGSLFARERGFPLVHVESGLRSGDFGMPEERNRFICDHFSSLLFAPTQVAIDWLSREGVKGEVILSGDVMQEGFWHFAPMAKQPQTPLPQNFILCTLHRQSNVDDPHRLAFLLKGLERVAQKQKILFPLHPRTKRRMDEFSLSFSANIIPIPPQGYLQTLWLILHASVVLTDSGGLQKESYFAKKKCLVLREVSEWSELVESGASELLASRGVDEAWEALSVFSAPSFLYGAERSVEIILGAMAERWG